MAKSKVRPFTYQEIEKFFENNTLTKIKHYGDGTEVRTLKGNLFLEGLTEKAFKSTHCSCSNIYQSHHTVVSNIIKKCYGYANQVTLTE